MPVDSRRSEQVGDERDTHGAQRNNESLDLLLQRLATQLDNSDQANTNPRRDVQAPMQRHDRHALPTHEAPTRQPMSQSGLPQRNFPPTRNRREEARGSPFGPTVEAERFGDADPFEQPRGASDMTHATPTRRPAGSSRVKAASPFQTTDEPWDTASADALSRLYEGEEAHPLDDEPERLPHTSPRMETPAVVGEQFSDNLGTAPVEVRLAEVARRIEAAVLELRPQARGTDITERFERFEKRFVGMLDNVATRGDIAGLRRVEARVDDLTARVDRTNGDVARLDRIEAQLDELREKLTDDQIVKLFGGLVPNEEDLARFAEDAATRALNRGASGEPRSDHAGTPLNVQSLEVAAAQSSAQIDTLQQILTAFIEDSRRGDRAVSESLESVQAALQHLLDRVDALEATGGSRGRSVGVSNSDRAPDVLRSTLDPGEPLHAEQNYSFADQTVSTAQPHFEPQLQKPVHETELGTYPQDQLDDPAPAVGSRRDGAPRGPMDRKQMIESARRAAEQARAASAAAAAAQAAGKSSKDRLGIVAAGKQSTATVRPGLLLAVTVAAFILAGSFFILGPKLKNSTSTPPPVPAATPQSEAPARGSRGPAVIEETQPTAPAQPQRRGMAPSGNDSEDTAVTSRIAFAAPAAAQPSEANEGARLGIAIQESPYRSSADEIIRARQRAHLASLSERTGRNAARNTGHAETTAASPTTGASEVTSETSPSVAPLVTRANVDLPPAQIGPSSLRAAAASGDASAQFEVAARFAEGKGVPKSFEQAAVWYQRAAAQGLSQAQYRLGTLYERGLGVKSDPARARIWYKRAADQGNLKAMHNLAVLTTNRDLGNPDYVAAAQLFERAAEHGLADSQYNLGILYETGLGVPMDRVTAYKWYTRAATAGDAEAARRRDLLKAKLDPAALARAEKLSASWRPQFSDPVANEARAAGEAWKRREARAD